MTTIRGMWVTLGLALAATAGEASHLPGFDTEVMPILAAHCVKCHGDGMMKGGLDLRTRESVLKGGKTAPAVVPSSLRDSLLWSKIATDAMPAKGPKLTDEQKETIRHWIVGGALEQAAGAAARARPNEMAPKLGVPATARALDADIDAKLAGAKIPTSPEADDAEFVRRIFVDLTGSIPSYERTVAFLASKDPERRSKLIDELLGSPEYGRYQAAIWHKLLLPNSAPNYGNMHHQAIKEWLAQQFNDNIGWDKLVTELLTAEGPAPSRSPPKAAKGKEPPTPNPASAYLSIHHEFGRPQPKSIAASSSRLFLGVQIECAQCHSHPFARWKRSDFWGVAAFFERIRFDGLSPAGDRTVGVLVEPTEGKALVNKDQPEFKVPAIRPEPIIDITDDSNLPTGKTARARYLGADEPEMDPGKSYRAVYARWMVDPNNPYFARAAVNRLWAQFFGKPLVDPIDDMQEDAPCSHPAILDRLANEFIASGFDRKHLIRCIANTRSYQRTTTPAKGNESDALLLSHQRMRLMGPEVFFASLETAFPAMSKLKEAEKGVPELGLFLETFAIDEQRPSDYSRGMIQALRLMNNDGKRFTADAMPSLAGAKTPVEVIDRIFLTLLNRPASERERSELLPLFGQNGSHAQLTTDLIWATVNRAEFLFNH